MQQMCASFFFAASCILPHHLCLGILTFATKTCLLQKLSWVSWESIELKHQNSRTARNLNLLTDFLNLATVFTLVSSICIYCLHSSKLIQAILQCSYCHTLLEWQIPRWSHDFAEGNNFDVDYLQATVESFILASAIMQINTGTYRGPFIRELLKIVVVVIVE